MGFETSLTEVCASPLPLPTTHFRILAWVVGRGRGLAGANLSKSRR